MADFTAIAATGQSLGRLLSSAFSDPSVPAPVPGHITRALIVQSETLQSGTVPRPALTLLLHRVTVDRTLRSASPRPGEMPAAAPLALALHFLLIPWAADAGSEQRILGRALQVLQQSPLLGGPLLIPSAAWRADDALQVVLEEWPTAELLRLFGALSTPFRASLAYIARLSHFDLIPPLGGMAPPRPIAPRR